MRKYLEEFKIAFNEKYRRNVITDHTTYKSGKLTDICVT